jgi:hypothetical protein
VTGRRAAPRANRSASSAPDPDLTTEERPATSDELLGELAHELSVLVRRELELAAAQNAPQLRQIGSELAVALAALVASLFALAALSWAAAQGLALVLPSWAASLIVAAGWAALAALLAWHEHPRRLARRLTAEAGEQALERAEHERDEAERAVKVTAERLGAALAREAAHRELEAGVSAVEKIASTAEHEAEDLLKEMLVALLAPGKTGISILERLIGRREPG